MAPWTGIVELAEQPKPQMQLPLRMAADYTDAEEKTKALDGVHTKRYLDTYSEVRKRIENARTQEERLFGKVSDREYAELLVPVKLGRC